MAKIRIDPNALKKKRSRRTRDPVVDSAAEMVSRAPKKTRTPPKPSGVKVRDSFFSRRGNQVEPGIGYDGTVLNHTRFIKTKPVRNPDGSIQRDPGSGRPLEADWDGTPVTFRFGSMRAGCPERNERGGYVEARRNPETHELDPDGEPVQVAGMRLLVRKYDHEKARNDFKKRMVMRENASKAKDAFESEADRLGIREHLTITSDVSHEMSNAPESAKQEN